MNNVAVKSANGRCTNKWVCRWRTPKTHLPPDVISNPITSCGQLLWHLGEISFSCRQLPM